MVCCYLVWFDLVVYFGCYWIFRLWLLCLTCWLLVVSCLCLFWLCVGGVLCGCWLLLLVLWFDLTGVLLSLNLFILAWMNVGGLLVWLRLFGCWLLVMLFGWFSFACLVLLWYCFAIVFYCLTDCGVRLLWVGELLLIWFKGLFSLVGWLFTVDW